MKRYPSLTSPFGFRLHFDSEEIDEACIEALRKANRLPDEPEPIKIDRFIEGYFGCPLEFKELDLGILGYTAFDADGGVVEIVISEDESQKGQPYERRLRSTMAHEAGHALLHPILFIQPWGASENQGVDFRKGRILCKTQHIDPSAKGTYDGRWWEWQANYAIGAFLLPIPLMLKALKEHVRPTPTSETLRLKEGAGRREKAVGELAETFDVNPIVARIRLDKTFPSESGQLSF